jgi:hypothetical protein
VFAVGQFQATAVVQDHGGRWHYCSGLKSRTCTMCL